MSDVAAVEDNLVKGPDTATVRDAIREAEVAMHAEYQRRASTTAGQGSPASATGKWLQEHASDRGLYAQAGETDTQLQARLATPLAVVTPDAICAAANAILAPLTSKRVRYFESILDRGFTNDGTPAWHAFVGAPASYPDRYYARDAATNGAACPNREVQGFWTFSDAGGRFFVLRVPDLGALGQQSNFVFDGSVLAGFWTENGADANASSFVASTGSALDAYQQIANAVGAIVGHSVRWMLTVDPTL